MTDDKFWQTYEEYCKMMQKESDKKKDNEKIIGSETGIEMEPGYEN